MTSVFLDDERNPSDVTWLHLPTDTKWVVVRNSEDFVLAVCSLLKRNELNCISFDHDIQDFDGFGGDEVTGYDCLKWVINLCMDDGYYIPTCYFHSKNPVGNENMYQYYINALTCNKKE